MKALDQAIRIFGTASALARAAGVSPQVLNNAVRRDSVSPDLALAIERATNGVVKKERLVWPDHSTKQAA